MAHLKNIIYVLVLFLLLSPHLKAQQQWMVFFKDKQRQDFNPYTYFDAKAIERRLRTGIPVDDPTDWPVNENYVNQVTSLVDEVIITSRWLNSVAVEASDAQLTAVKLLPYVLSVEWIEPSEMPVAAYNDYDTTLDAGRMQVLEGQLRSL